ncbi:hypothetical protein ATB98_16660 [Sinorhizobium saheli]|uniref:Adenosylmethionine-8-amino-7-oxononanoate aminotransferase n=1 Tax=Sinorhizobium saheli TaxID=36856 RepID=A0A178YRX0_SINSA|nr:hypothetical protein ATB98_16660 [Sinorhizobium saheli]
MTAAGVDADRALFQRLRDAPDRQTRRYATCTISNPIACAAAVANLDIWRNEPVLERIESLEAMHRKNLARFEGDDRFTNMRQMGTIAALDLVVPSGGYLAEVGPRMRRLFRERGLLIRPLGNVIYLMPPYCVTADELGLAYDAIDEVASIVLGKA